MNEPFDRLVAQVHEQFRQMLVRLIAPLTQALARYASQQVNSVSQAISIRLAGAVLGEMLSIWCEA